MILLSLIGEQPIPNLLPIRHFKPSTTLAVHSDFTQKAAARLEKLIAGQVAFWPLQVNAYDIHAIQTALLAEIQRRKLAASDLLFNLTGGTKPMSLAAYLVAAELGAPLVYLQSEGKRSRLFRYEFREGTPVLMADSILPGLIKIDDYLHVYVDAYTRKEFSLDQEGGRFERAIFDILAPAVDEILPGVNLQGAVDIDLVVRCGNQVGIVEVKLGLNKLKMAIDQLNTAGGQKYLGTYTQKFLVSDQTWSERSNLKALAEARQITVIELPGYGLERTLSVVECEKLQALILKGLGRS
ncbi:MAG: DUF1887 family CARF protein [Anaerolineales bacterium]|nr:DUF1887 family CARF protein [Anaerolineales bacterium]